MNKHLLKFFKKHFIISAAISVAAGAVILAFTEMSVASSVIISMSVMGTFSAIVLVLGLFFPKLVVKNYFVPCDPEKYVTVYYYGDYVNGFCKVMKMYGDPNDPENMKRTYSFVDRAGNYITDRWFADAGNFENDRVIVAIEDYRFNIMDGTGNLICANDHVGMSSEMSDGTVKVTDGENGVNYVDVRTGRELWDEWKKELYAEQ